MNCLLAIVPRPHGQHAYEAAYAAGAPGGTLLPARVLATSSILQLLGLGDTSADVLLTVVPDDRTSAIAEAIRAYAAHARLRSHLVLAIPALHFLRAAPTPLALTPEKEPPMTTPTPATPATPAENADPAPDSSSAPFRLIIAILNKGYAEDAMAAARAAGATGGTVLSARGTAKPGDAEFFGVPLVPEKDQLLILAAADLAPAVTAAIQALPCFAQKGSGVLFTLPATAFLPLGH
ncbi:MAG: hypothetical protein IJT88_08135 [Kiritimatiellae bacterium]|nr:hypothetical protein [Kiritimatiellia bacterium]